MLLRIVGLRKAVRSSSLMQRTFPHCAISLPALISIQPPEANVELLHVAVAADVQFQCVSAAFGFCAQGLKYFHINCQTFKTSLQ